MSVILSGGSHAASDHTPPIATSRTALRDAQYVRLDFAPSDRREIVRAFVCALRGHATTGSLVAIRNGNLLESAAALTEVADDPEVVDALTLLLSPADADDLSVALDEASTIHTPLADLRVGDDNPGAVAS